MKIKLENKFDNEPEFVKGRFSLEINSQFKIGTFRVLETIDRTKLYLEIGIWDKQEQKTRSNIFIKGEMQNKIIMLWVKTLKTEDPQLFEEIVQLQSVQDLFNRG